MLRPPCYGSHATAAMLRPPLRDCLRNFGPQFRKKDSGRPADSSSDALGQQCTVLCPRDVRAPTPAALLAVSVALRVCANAFVP